MKSLKFYLLIICCFTMIQLRAQTALTDYFDGIIYLKLENSSNLILGDVDDVLADEHLSVFQDKIAEYDIHKIERPFTALKTPVFDRTYKIHFNKILKVDELMRELETIAEVEYAEPMPIRRVDYIPNDPMTGTQYALPLINAYEAWDTHKGGGALVAIVDDACLIGHSDLADNIYVNIGEVPGNGVDDDNNGYIDDVNGYDVADNDANPNPPGTAGNFFFSHGTHCSGIAGAVTDNANGVASIGFFNKILPVKTTYNTETLPVLNETDEGVAFAIASNADVISMSYGGGGFSQTDQNLFDQAHTQGIVLVAAAGNDGNSTLQYPAGYNHVIGVANTNSSDVKNNSSNYGTWVDISAPGTSIRSTVATNNFAYEYYDGTSMACPMVAGLVGLMKSYAPNLTPDLLEECLFQSADDIDALNPSFAGLLGARRINAQAALLCASPTVPPIVDFDSDYEAVGCPNLYVQYESTTQYSGTHMWTFPGGTPATSMLENPVVYYPNGGNYDAELIVTNPYGADTLLIPSYIGIDGGTGTETFLFEDFEGGDLAATGWTVDNPDSDNSWDLAAVEGSTRVGNYAAKMSFRNYFGVGELDGLISPVLDFTDRSAVSLRFDHAYANFLVLKADELKIRVSTDGGATYPNVEFSVMDDGGSAFATSGQTNLPFTPDNQTEWCFGNIIGTPCFEVDLSAYDGMSNIRIKFEGVNDNGNNLYVDNIEIRSNCKPLTGNEGPLAVFTSNVLRGCDNVDVDFVDISAGNPTAWSWSFPGGTPSSSTMQNPTVNYPAAGEYEVELTVTNANGTNTVTDTSYILVQSTPEADFAYSSSLNTVQFTNSSLYAESYLWDFGDGTQTINPTPTHNYLNPGVYDVTLYANGPCGVDSMTLTIVTGPEAIFTQSTSTGCTPLSIDFTDMSTPTPTTWMWEFQDGTPATSSMQNPSVVFNSGGVKTVSLTVSNAGGDNTTSTFIVVSETPTANYDFTALSNLDVQFNNMSTAGTSASWDFGDGSAMASEQNPLHTFASEGTYNVCVTSTNGCGTDTYCEDVAVLDVGLVAPEEVLNAKVYPNPNTGVFRLELENESSEDIEIQIFNVLGKEVYRAYEGEHQGLLSKYIVIGNKTSGTYMLRIRAGEKVMYQKIVVH